MTPEEEFQRQLDELREENQLLRQQLAQVGNDRFINRGRDLLRRFTLFISGLAAGRGLRRSMKRLYSELPGNVTRNTLADVSSHVIWRITRIGIFAISAAIIPILVLVVQTGILSSQNEKLDYQNRLIRNQNLRLDQQVQLDESHRRSSFIFLMSNIMDKIDEELKNAQGGTRKLSDELIGRIAALSQALLPYRYLENDRLTPGPLSPERGQLLFALVSSLLDEDTYDKIYEKSNFSYAELKQANFGGAYLRHVNLEHAHLPDAVFLDADLGYARLNMANLTDTHLENVNLRGAQMRGVNLRSSEIVNVDFDGANMQGVDLRLSRINGYFSNCRLDDLLLDNAEIEFALLDDARFQSRSWLESLNEKNLKGLYSIRENYEMRPEVVVLGPNRTDTVFRLQRRMDSKLLMMGDCERKVLEIVRSTPEVQTLVEKTRRRGEQIIYLTEAGPFGSENLGMARDSNYQVRVTTADAGLLDVLIRVRFDPRTRKLYEVPLTNADTIRELSYARGAQVELPDYCQ